MAEFSKQWCDLHDNGMEGDFDIEEIYNGLPENHYEPIICEGFGSVAVGDKEGECYLAFPISGSEEVEWRSFRDVIKQVL